MILFRRRQTNQATETATSLPSPFPGKLTYGELRRTIRYVKAIGTAPNSRAGLDDALSTSPFLRYLIPFSDQETTQWNAQELSDEAKQALDGLLHAATAQKQRPSEWENATFDTLKTGLKFKPQQQTLNILAFHQNASTDECDAHLARIRRLIKSDLSLASAQRDTLAVIDGLREIIRDIDGSIRDEYQHYFNKEKRTKHIRGNYEENYYCDAMVGNTGNHVILHLDHHCVVKNHVTVTLPWIEARVTILDLSKQFLLSYFKAMEHGELKQALSRVNFWGGCIEAATRGMLDYTESLGDKPIKMAMVLQYFNHHIDANIPKLFGPTMDTAIASAKHCLDYLYHETTIEHLSEFIQAFYEDTLVEDNGKYITSCERGPLSKLTIFLTISPPWIVSLARLSWHSRLTMYSLLF